MDPHKEIWIIEHKDQIPTLDSIRSFPRGNTLVLVCGYSAGLEKEKIILELKERLTGFLVSAPFASNEIHIRKLITDEEIEKNSQFFERCAKDYRVLAIQLMQELVATLGIELNKEYPMASLNPLKSTRHANGTIGKWRYYLHGYDCGFEHLNTKQDIEVTMVHGEEFGALDPYFFSKYIKSSKAYQPLPVEIFEDYHDGQRIIQKMTDLGKFEFINSNIPEKYTAVVTDRNKVPVKTFHSFPQKQNASRSSFWNWFKIRRN